MADITNASVPDSEKTFISPEHIAEAQATLNKKLAKQCEDQIKQFRNTGAV